MSVIVAFTGGTISMVQDEAAGGNVPALDGAAILARTPGLAEIAEIHALELGRTPASHFSFDQLFGFLQAVRDGLARPGATGAVIVQGTDTIEETSFFFDLLWDDPRPLVIVGAMRSASDPGYDGPANLRAAVRVAVSPDARGQGCLVVMAGEIHAADDVTKTHTTALDTFQSLNAGPVGTVTEAGAITWHRRRATRRQVVAERAAEPIALVTATVGDDPRLADAVIASGVRGLVVEATGSGNTSPGLLAASSRAIAAGIPVVHASRCPSGGATADYAFPGGGATWRAAGALGCGLLGGPKARIALALGLGAGLDRSGLAALLAGPVTDDAPNDAPSKLRSDTPIDTPALTAVVGAGIPHEVIRTDVPHSPEESARLQGIDLRALLRTIVVRRGTDDYVFVLVPGGRRFDWPKLRAALGVSRLSLPDQDEAQAVTGYERGAITPFGASRAWPVIADASITGFERVAIGGGRRGVNLHLAPADLVAATGALVVDVTAPETPAG